VKTDKSTVKLIKTSKLRLKHLGIKKDIALEITPHDRSGRSLTGLDQLTATRSKNRRATLAFTPITYNITRRKRLKLMKASNTTISRLEVLRPGTLLAWLAQLVSSLKARRDLFPST